MKSVWASRLSNGALKIQVECRSGEFFYRYQAKFEIFQPTCQWSSWWRARAIIKAGIKYCDYSWDELKSVQCQSVALCWWRRLSGLDNGGLKGGSLVPPPPFWSPITGNKRRRGGCFLLATCRIGKSHAQRRSLTCNIELLRETCTCRRIQRLRTSFRFCSTSLPGNICPHHMACSCHCIPHHMIHPKGCTLPNPRTILRNNPLS
jgi:hypothetical protein